MVCEHRNLFVNISEVRNPRSKSKQLRYLMRATSRFVHNSFLLNPNMTNGTKEIVGATFHKGANPNHVGSTCMTQSPPCGSSWGEIRISTCEFESTLRSYHNLTPPLYLHQCCPGFPCLILITYFLWHFFFLLSKVDWGKMFQIFIVMR